MKISLSWINDYVKLPDKLDIAKLAYDLTMTTVEVENVTHLRGQFEGMIVGVVEKIEKHPDADKLVVCSVNIGQSHDDETTGGSGIMKQIVCGGSNLFEGMKVAVAPPGSFVRWHGEGDYIELKKAKIRGVSSFGMICSSSEIGLFDLFPFEDEATIVDLTEYEKEVGVSLSAGTPLSTALGLDDTILEIDNKSLTNRPDLWGHYGIAREIAAIYDLEFPREDCCDFTSDLNIAVPDSDFKISLNDTDGCRRYIGVKIDDVSVLPAPFHIRSRLWRVGTRPINAIVDVTNYVMLATGQPTHAFDADVIRGNICVRRAFENEELLLLDGRELKLSASDLVIADDENAIALAGVMGGEKDSILPGTRNIVLEIANFNPIFVRKTSLRHDVRTESSSRFEKGIDTQRADMTLSIAIKLLGEIFPAMKITGFHDNYAEKTDEISVDVSIKWLFSRLGKSLSNSGLEGLLARLGFLSSFDGDNMTVAVPSWRATGDVSLPEDIVEEVARCIGYDNFEPTPITASFEGDVNQPDIDIDRKIREYLAFRSGMFEIFSYPWVEDKFRNVFASDLSGSQMLELEAPPSQTERFIRSSLLPGLTKAVASNLRYFEEFSIFESGRVFSGTEFTAEYDEREHLPLERRFVSGAFVGRAGDYESLFRRSKGVIESLPAYVHAAPLSLKKYEKPSWADDVIWLNIVNDSDSKLQYSSPHTAHDYSKVGDLALLSQKAMLELGIKNASVMLFEIDLCAILPLGSRSNSFEHISEYPSTKYDISLVFDSSVSIEKILDVSLGKRSAENLLREVSFVDEYRGEQVPDGKRSVTLRLLIGSLEKTLTSDDIDIVAGAVIKRLEKQLGAVLR